MIAKGAASFIESQII